MTAEDGTKLHAWFMHPRGWSREARAQRPVVLFFQENAGNMSFRLPFLRLLMRYLDCSVFALRCVWPLLPACMQARWASSLGERLMAPGAPGQCDAAEWGVT